MKNNTTSVERIILLRACHSKAGIEEPRVLTSQGVEQAHILAKKMLDYLGERRRNRIRVYTSSARQHVSTSQILTQYIGEEQYRELPILSLSGDPVENAEQLLAVIPLSVYPRTLILVTHEPIIAYFSTLVYRLFPHVDPEPILLNIGEMWIVTPKESLILN